MKSVEIAGIHIHNNGGAVMVDVEVVVGLRKEWRRVYVGLIDDFDSDGEVSEIVEPLGIAGGVIVKHRKRKGD